MALCWKCSRAEYHDYKDKHGLRCPICGQKESHDPSKQKPVEVVKTPPVKRATTQRSKR